MRDGAGRADAACLHEGVHPRLLKHGGHPALATRKVGGYVDAWMVEPDPGWSIVGFMLPLLAAT